jgi:diguanylate cyclase (GGDEF)-like protein/PAS domain S-box-containing protein
MNIGWWYVEQIFGLGSQRDTRGNQENRVLGHPEISLQLTLDRVTRMVSILFDMPCLFLTTEVVMEPKLISAYGIREDLRESEEQIAFCEQLVSYHDSIVTHNFSLQSGVCGVQSIYFPAGIGFYAGTSIINSQGKRVGILAVLGTQASDFTDKDRKIMQEFGELVLTQLELNADIELRQQTMHFLVESQECYKTLVEHSPEMIDVHDNKKLLYINPTGANLLGVDRPDELIGGSIFDVIHPDNWLSVKQQADLFKKNDRSYRVLEQKLVTLDGRILDVEVKATPITYKGQSAVLAISRDITKQKREKRKWLKVHEHLIEIATVDGLTGVSNRRMLNDFLTSEWSRSIRNSTPISLIMLDVDYFKSYNDTYGHLIGDECLITVAQAIKEGLTRSSDLLARFGGEEFAIVLPETNSEGAMHVAERIRGQVEMLAIPHIHSKLPGGMITVSIGVSTLMGSIDTDGIQLIETADKALYASKRNGRNQVSCYIND